MSRALAPTWLPLAEYWFNTNYHTSIKLTPFEALYGFQSSKILNYIPGLTMEAVLRSICRLDSIF